MRVAAVEWAGLACDVRLRCCDKDEDEDTDEGAGTGKDGWLVAEAVAVALGLAAAPLTRGRTHFSEHSVETLYSKDS